MNEQSRFGSAGGEVPLHRIAHGRTGDKGNRLNVSVVAYRPEFFPILREQVTAERVKAIFSHRGATRVERYELPNLWALNFIIDEVLEGGVNDALNLDGHGKTHSFLVLSLPIRIPTEFEAIIKKEETTK